MLLRDNPLVLAVISCEMFIVRYADDIVFAFQHQKDAGSFRAALAERLRRFGLELHREKTRRIEFGRHAERDRRNRGQGPPETFDFLGLTPICETGKWLRSVMTGATSIMRFMEISTTPPHDWTFSDRFPLHCTNS